MQNRLVPLAATAASLIALFPAVASAGYTEYGDAAKKDFQSETETVAASAAKGDCRGVAQQYAGFVAKLDRLQADPAAESAFYYNSLLFKDAAVRRCVAGSEQLTLVTWSYLASLYPAPEAGDRDPVEDSASPAELEAVLSLLDRGKARDALQVRAFEAVVRPRQQELLKSVRERATTASPNPLEQQLDRLAMTLRVNEIVADVLDKQGLIFYASVYRARQERLEEEFDEALNQLGDERTSIAMDWGAIFSFAANLSNTVGSASRKGMGRSVSSMSMNQLLSTTLDSYSKSLQTGGDASTSISDALSSALKAYLSSKL